MDSVEKNEEDEEDSDSSSDWEQVVDDGTNLQDIQHYIQIQSRPPAKQIKNHEDQLQNQGVISPEGKTKIKFKFVQGMQIENENSRAQVQNEFIINKGNSGNGRLNGERGSHYVINSSHLGGLMQQSTNDFTNQDSGENIQNIRRTSVIAHNQNQLQSIKSLNPGDSSNHSQKGKNLLSPQVNRMIKIAGSYNDTRTSNNPQNTSTRNQMEANVNMVVGLSRHHVTGDKEQFQTLNDMKVQENNTANSTQIFSNQRLQGMQKKKSQSPLGARVVRPEPLKFPEIKNKSQQGYFASEHGNDQSPISSSRKKVYANNQASPLKLMAENELVYSKFEAQRATNNTSIHRQKGKILQLRSLSPGKFNQQNQKEKKSEKQ